MLAKSSERKLGRNWL